MSPFFVAFLLGAIPSATSFTDSATGVSLDLDLPGFEECFIRPNAMRSEEACEGLDPTAAEQTLTAETRASLVARNENELLLLTVTVIPGPLSLRDSELKRYFEGVRAGYREQTGQDPVLRGLDPGRTYDKVTLGSSTFLRFVIELPEVPGTDLNRMVTYVVPSGRKMLNVLVHTSETGLNSIVPVVETALAAARIPPAHGRAETSEAFQLGQALGRMVGSLFCLAVICGAAVALYRLLRGRKAPPAPRVP